MGGVNHQPTSNIRLIGPSAWLSQKVGEGFAAVLEANSQLENAIMLGIDRLHVEVVAQALDGDAVSYLDRVNALLESSVAKISEIQTAYAALIEAAGLENYRGNPLASRVGELALADAFEGELVLPTINRDTWSTLEGRIGDVNILKTLEWESREFEKVLKPTQDLIDVIRTCREIATRQGKRQFVEAVERNHVRVRQEYARVFSLWNYLHAMFMYSALIMTELFYRTNGYSSLLEHSASSQARSA